MFPIGLKKENPQYVKGMQRQAALIALSTCPEYLFLDEIFDGLDPRYAPTPQTVDFRRSRIPPDDRRNRLA